MKTLEIRENPRKTKGVTCIQAANHSAVFKLATKLTLKQRALIHVDMRNIQIASLHN